MTFSTASITRELLPREVISQIESSLLLSRRLPTTVVDDISTFLTTSSTGALQVFRPSTQPNKLRSAIAMVLAQPEYILQTGIDRPIVTENTAQSVLANATGKLLFVELGGGYDWLHGVVPKNEFQTYTNKRTNTSGTIGISQTQMTDLDDTYYINRALAFGSGGTASLKSLYDSNNLRVFNRVGTNRHSRSHDEAQRQIASYASTTEEEAEGVFGQLIRSEPSSDATISLTGRRPNVFRGGRYINIGPSGAVLTN